MSLSKFQKMLNGWRTSDGEDICPRHWKELINRLDLELRATITKDSSLMSKKSIATTRKCLEGWRVGCSREEADGSFCREVVFVPFRSS